MRRYVLFTIIMLGAVAGGAMLSAQGELQPALYRGGAARNGFIKEPVSPPLTLLWKFATFETYRNNNCTPIVSGDGKVFFAVNKDVYGLDAATGDPLWTKKTPDGSVSHSLTLTDAVAAPLAFFPPNLLLVGTKASREKSLVAINTDKGTAAWDFNAGGAVYGSPLAAGNNQVLFGTTSGVIWGGTLAVDGMTDTWRVPPTDSLGGAVQGSLAVAGNMAYAVAGDLLYAVSIPNRKMAWTAQLGDSAQSGPIIVNDQIIVAAGERLVGFSQKGIRLWVKPLSSGARINSAPAARGTTLFFGADEYLYAFDLMQKRSPWRVKAKVDGRVLASPFVTDKGVFAGTARGFLVGANLDNGSVQWNYKLPNVGTGTNAVTASPVIVNGRMYVVSDDGTLFCFSAENVDTAEPVVVEASIKVTANDRKPAKYPIDPWADDLAPDEFFVVPGRGPISFEFLLEDFGSGIDWDTVKVYLDEKELKLKSDSNDPSNNSINPIKGTVTAELVGRAIEGSTGRPLADGNHKVTLRVRNWAGNERTDIRPFRVDNAALPPPAPPRDDSGGTGGAGRGGNSGALGGPAGGRAGGGSGGGGRGGGS